MKIKMFKDLYKKNLENSAENQEYRRKQLLLEQKKHRQELQDDNRTNSNLVTPEYFSNKTTRESTKPTFAKKYGIAHTLQLSEWFREMPDDLLDWILVPCPIGQRCFVVAHNGYTEMYNKSGRRCFGFRSKLPGDFCDKKQITILDCIYNRDEDMFYVLDALSLSTLDLLTSEAQFRFFWLKSKFEEYEIEPEKCAAQNRKSFELLKRYDLENSIQVNEALQRFPYWNNDAPKLDGFLFYHKEASYTCGTTPLVCWLFPFMVPDVLHLAVNSEYQRQRPENYTTAQEFMLEFDAELRMKRKKLQTNGNGKQMDFDETTTESTIETQIEATEESDLMSLLEREQKLECEGMTDY